MIDNLLHHFRLVEFARDAADHRMLDEARIAQRSEAEQGGQEIGGRVRTHTILPLVPRQRRVAERAGL
ncbi:MULTISPECIES: hypothetical protein [Streptomyces]|uniref:hypothetical protein n=1 Tax=Streptomyces TaxID=1883 RepID=UPI00163BDC60|nr:MULTISPECIES: hypothetical protein [Streptomyces]MBC2874582.1 hypothetical protein [Streptomyces sp. TYQ1024]UBI36652.1 hypothetical protein K7I03_09375 [Streptomyces mobaraensis]UKW29245.1 hypothetical protein MCU78_09350 [Streptomyces sp. TYQ1024]